MSMGTIALPSVTVRQHNATCRGMLRPSLYGDAVCVCVCVNIAIEINVLYYSIVVHSVNGVLCIIIGLLVSDQSAQRS